MRQFVFHVQRERSTAAATRTATAAVQGVRDAGGVVVEDPEPFTFLAADGEWYASSTFVATVPDTVNVANLPGIDRSYRN